MSGLPADREVGATLERLADQLGLRISQQKHGRARLVRPDGTAVQTWRQDYPYDRRLSRGFIHRQLDPVKQWKLSPIDLASLDKWHEYTAAK